jgi:hypothetical protein
MLEALLAVCTSSSVLFWVVVVSDLSIAAAYFAIPVTMAIVMRQRREDIVYPWLWVLFVAFIMACGLTHLVHVWSATVGAENLGLLALAEATCAIVSVSTAIAFALILPEIRMLPSPARQRQMLEAAVAERTNEKDLLIREINHRIGNQLQVLQSVVSIEERKADSDAVLEVLGRLRLHLDRMSQDHRDRSAADYLASHAAREAEAPRPGLDSLRPSPSTS